MNISSATNVGSSSATHASSGTSPWQQMKQSLSQLSEALSSGNLDSAKKAFSTLSANAPKGISADPNSALSKIGQALQAGDVQAAQAALSAMQTGGRHHHADSDASAIKTPAAVTPPTPAANTGTLINTMA